MISGSGRGNGIERPVLTPQLAPVDSPPTQKTAPSILDQFGPSRVDRFSSFAELHRTGDSKYTNLDPSSADFEANMGQKYDARTFDTWAAIAQILVPFIEALLQMLQGMGGSGDAGGEDNGGGGSIDPISDTTPKPVDGDTATSLPNEELFGAGGPSAKDVEQGNLGDCYFLSTLGGVATEDPQILEKNIRQHVDPSTGEPAPGLYDVRFYKQDAEGNTVEQWVTVNDKLLRDGSGAEDYAQTTDNDHDGKQELWVAIYEKAYAKFKSQDGTVDDGYAEIGKGGWGGEAYFAVTGKTMNGSDPSQMDARSVASILGRTNPSDGDVVMVGSKSDDSGLVAEGIPSGHMYQVLGTYTDPSTGETMVTLRNPWGCFEPGMISNGDGTYSTNGRYDGTNDGIFSIPLSQLQQDFDLMTYPDQSRYDAKPLALAASAIRG